MKRTTKALETINTKLEIDLQIGDIDGTIRLENIGKIMVTKPNLSLLSLYDIRTE